MKIVSVCRTYPTQRPGGMPHVTQDRARALARAGHDVTVVTTSLKDDGRTELDDDGVRVVHTACPSQAYTPLFAERCRWECEDLAPDVIHLDSFDRARPWWVGLSARTVVTMHGFGVGAMLTSWNKFLAGGRTAPMPDWSALRDEADVLQTFDRVLAISTHEQWMLSDVYNLQDRVRLVPNPIAPYFFDMPWPVPAVPAAPFVCIGNPGTSGNRDFGRVRDAARAAGVPLEVITGVERSRIPQMLDESQGLVLPTLWSQGYDLAVAEALARRRPVIVSGTGSYWHLRAPYVRVIPRAAALDVLVEALQAALPEVPAGAADDHRPNRHVDAWEAALA